jgi:hypothetical protein
MHFSGIIIWTRCFMMNDQHKTPVDQSPAGQPGDAQVTERPVLPKEIGGRDGPEPTRYGDWEKNGRCIDF